MFKAVFFDVFVNRFTASPASHGLLLGAFAIDGRIGSACALFSGAAGDLRRIGRVRELVVDDNNESADASKRRGQGVTLFALLNGDGKLILLSHSFHLLFIAESIVHRRTFMLSMVRGIC